MTSLTPAVPGHPGAAPDDARPTRSGIPADPGAAPDAAARNSGPEVSLGQRLRQPRTLVSIALPIVLLALIVQNLPGFELDRIPGLIGAANPLLLLAGFGIFYLGFPLRGLRWTIILGRAGLRIRARDATEILFLSWLVNCLVPAKLGDVYRAYLLKINTPVSGSKTLGTVFIERILDLFAIALLGLAAGFWSFRDGLPPEIQVVFALGLVVVAGLAVALFTMRNFGRRIIVRLPLPQRIIELYDRFEEGVFGAIDPRALPKLGVITAAIWATEGLRLWLVVQALALPDVSLGISGAFFVAFIGSLLTAVPLSPAGLGIVEAGIVGVLTLAYGVSPTHATAIALVDRAISVFSIILLGSIAYAVSAKRRGTGIPSEATGAAAGG